jgi:hypothetical protein
MRREIKFDFAWNPSRSEHTWYILYYPPIMIEMDTVRFMRWDGWGRMEFGERYITPKQIEAYRPIIFSTSNNIYINLLKRTSSTRGTIWSQNDLHQRISHLASRDPNSIAWDIVAWESESSALTSTNIRVVIARRDSAIEVATSVIL